MCDEEVLNRVKIFVMNVDMSVKPVYYAGRGANTFDLDSYCLEGIYQQILYEYGGNAGSGFIDMVKTIKSLDATTFLISLYALCLNNWNWFGLLDCSDTDLNNDCSAVFTLFSFLKIDKKDETELIRKSFLERDSKFLYLYSLHYERKWKHRFRLIQV